MREDNACTHCLWIDEIAVYIFSIIAISLLSTRLLDRSLHWIVDMVTDNY